MKVSFYELLGMIKENKQPKKVIYNDVVYIWTGNEYEKKDIIMPSLIVVENKSLRCKINDNKMFEKNITILESNGEIIEEDNKIEPLDIHQEKNCKNNWKWKCNGYNISTPQKIIGEKLNEVIIKLNKMEENK